ncbi:hypothetical protein N473_23705 [Pseudoalteromonas luteoviolacea CPMOR-1]|uniref:Uncharacterized protein n=1 Tax=Pseudoalteromonas luteoviolacea CPMOR-1 TaxID=1365248 RepID=A0A161YI07_9GAMM|nr:hypothetical protein N473_23705 [Pseudoalteromonas luteoviolacea CPMOR-1]
MRVYLRINKNFTEGKEMKLNKKTLKKLSFELKNKDLLKAVAGGELQIQSITLMETKTTGAGSCGY